MEWKDIYLHGFVHGVCAGMILFSLIILIIDVIKTPKKAPPTREGAKPN
jgi:hypothetical protein